MTERRKRVIVQRRGGVHTRGGGAAVNGTHHMSGSFCSCGEFITHITHHHSPASMRAYTCLPNLPSERNRLNLLIPVLPGLAGKSVLRHVAAILCTGGPDMIRKEAWPFYRTISSVRLFWQLEEPKGPKGRAKAFSVCRRRAGPVWDL